MKTKEIFRRLLEALEQAGIPYMLTGSFASSFHGTPRATHDIDVVIDPTEGSLRELLRAFPPDAYYVSEEAALRALARQSQFNVVDYKTGWKIDFIIRKHRPFSVEEFRRRRQAELFGHQLYVASAEDVLIAKLLWAKLGSSERQIEDAAGILRARGDQLDQEYIQRWVERLGLQGLWKRIS